MSGPIDSKSNTCTESSEVDTAGISVKVFEPYPGRSQGLSKETGLQSSKGDGKSFEKSAEGIVGSQRTEGLNLLAGVESIFCVF